MPTFFFFPINEEVDVNLPSTATMHFLSKQTAHGSWHGAADSLALQPHSLSGKIKTETKEGGGYQ